MAFSVIARKAILARRWDPARFPWVKAMEAAAADIAGELRAEMAANGGGTAMAAEARRYGPDFFLQAEGIHSGGAWSEMFVVQVRPAPPLPWLRPWSSRARRVGAPCPSALRQACPDELIGSGGSSASLRRPPSSGSPRLLRRGHFARILLNTLAP
jgi:hypothetical protein